MANTYKQLKEKIVSEKTEHVPIAFWGKDHYSALAYIETRCVDHKGTVDNRHLRADPKLHPGLCDARNHATGYEGNTPPAKPRKEKFPPTRLKGGIKKANHDDWSCLEDMESAGLLTWEGTGLNPVFVFTDLGKEIAAALRGHKMNGDNFAGFEVPLAIQAKLQPEVLQGVANAAG